ncbi:MAG: COP23 domain-containing protein [Cyanobacteria bacterium P01_A01_bin.116]
MVNFLHGFPETHQLDVIYNVLNNELLQINLLLAPIMYQPSFKVCLSSILSVPLLLIPISALEAQTLPTQLSQQSKQAASKTPTLDSLLSELTEAELPSADQSSFSPVRQPALDEFITDDMEISFFCGSDSGIPKTIVNNPIGEFTLIEWTKEFYPETNETPLDRCYSVASIFQDYYQQGLFSQIIAGDVEGSPAICVSDLSGNSCGRVILLLEAGENAENVADALQKSLLLLALEPVESVSPSLMRDLASSVMLSIALPTDEENFQISRGDNTNIESSNAELETHLLSPVRTHSSTRTHPNDPERFEVVEPETLIIPQEPESLNEEGGGQSSASIDAGRNIGISQDTDMPTAVAPSEPPSLDVQTNVNDEIHLYKESLASYLRIVNNSESFSAVTPAEENIPGKSRFIHEQNEFEQSESVERVTGGGGFLGNIMHDAPSGPPGNNGRVHGGGSR